MNNMNKKKENARDDFAAIGIGAMIVFIALILVAAVASAVIIQTGEKLQQNAQQTGADTQQEIGGKISIISIPRLANLEANLFFNVSKETGGEQAKDVSSTKNNSFPKSIAYKKDGGSFNSSSVARPFVVRSYFNFLSGSLLAQNSFSFSDLSSSGSANECPLNL